MNKLIVNLSGGIGNQFFQYACARSLSVKFNLELYLDRFSGFIRDKQYNRRYELNNFSINSKLSSIFDIIPYTIAQKIYKKKFKRELFTKTSFGNFISEIQTSWLPEIYDLNFGKKCWIKGYWQSPRYFNGITDILSHELMPRSPTNHHVIELGKELNNCDSVSVGIRLYEESLDPSVHALDGRIKPLSDFNQVFDKIMKVYPEAKFFVFCTHDSSLLNKISFPRSTNLIFSKFKNISPYDTLWLLSRCRHHVFNNSSFYWWGAWLSQFIHKKYDQIIYSSDNFINKDGICSDWKTF